MQKLVRLKERVEHPGVHEKNTCGTWGPELGGENSLQWCGKPARQLMG